MARPSKKFSISRLVQGLGLSKADSSVGSTWPDKVTLDIRGEAVVLACARIILIEAKGDYLSFVTADNAYRTHANMGQMEKSLNPSIFLRIHRSTIVNKKKIARVANLSGGRLNFHMSNDQVVASSQKYQEAISKALPDLK